MTEKREREVHKMENSDNRMEFPKWQTSLIAQIIVQ